MVNMLFLAKFSPMLPDPGLIFWTALIFLIVWITLGRMAFRPIQEALKKREEDIQSSLDEAKKAREEIQNLQARNEVILKEAQEERARILREAKEVKENIIKEAKGQAKEEAQKIVQNAKEEIENMKKEAMINVKNELGNMAIDIAEKVLRNKLKGDQEQENLVKQLVDGIKFN